ncbi:zf-HC2 domain-containing protein [Bremerella cremea]|uniref:anti-sigma factor family protein n=1 Tax=Bremerella cremea TaxID=1031537 RepID=UPI0031EB2F40
MSEREPWIQCPAGELSKLQQSLQARDAQTLSRRRFLMAGGGAAAAVAGGGLLVLTLGQRQGDCQNLTCIAAVELMPSYIDGTLTDQQARTSLEAHLDRCPKCQRHLEELEALI